MEAAGMRFVVERDALAEAVAWIARSLPSRPVLPVLSGLLLQAAADGLTMSCFDYEVSARISIDADVTEPGTALVPGRLLAEITRSLPGHPVEVDDKDDVTLTCGPASFSLVTLPIGEYPRLPELPRLAGTVDGGVFATAIGQVAPAARATRSRSWPPTGTGWPSASWAGVPPVPGPAARSWSRPRRWPTRPG
jgi:DNA polymerase-3 subunit beta